MKTIYEQRQKETAALIEDHKRKLADKHRLSRNEKFELAYRIAWDNGHASGFREIEYYFDELVPLLK